MRECLLCANGCEYCDIIQTATITHEEIKKAGGPIKWGELLDLKGVPSDNSGYIVKMEKGNNCFNIQWYRG